MSDAIVSIVRHSAAAIIAAATLIVSYAVVLILFVAMTPILAIVRLAAGKETARRTITWLLERVAATNAIFETMAANITATLI